MLAIAYATFLVNMFYGISVRAGLIPRGRYRWIHHAIYATAMTALVVALVTTIVAGDGSWPRIAAMVAILAAMPRFPGREPSHVYYAIFALIIYSLVVFVQ